MNKKRNWGIAAIVAAAAGFLAVQNALAPSSPDTATATGTKLTSVEIATFTPTYEGCAFIWASHDDPKMTERLDATVRALDPEASANASLYGEDCVYADGHSTFSIMETDFYVRLPVDDLSNEEALGNWMKQVLDAILQIPREEIRGNDGFVDFWFIKSETENLTVHVPLQRYRSEAQGITGAKLLQMFYKKQ